MNERYTLRVSNSAEKELRHVDRMMMERLTRAIDSLAMEPRPNGCKKLVASGNLWRVRVGEYRIVYEIHDRERLIRVVAMTHRSKAYS